MSCPTCEEAEDIARRPKLRLQTDDGLSSPMVVVAPNRLCATARERDEARAEVERYRAQHERHIESLARASAQLAAARGHVEALVGAIGPCSGVCSRPGAYAAARAWLEEMKP